MLEKEQLHHVDKGVYEQAYRHTTSTHTKLTKYKYII